MGIYEENNVPIKIIRLAEYVSGRKRISLFDALVYIYSNPMCGELYNEEAKWWYLSSEDLYHYFEKRRDTQGLDLPIEAFEFFAYMVEMYARSRGVSGFLAMAMFKEYGVDDFLIKNYDLLHTQGTEYVVGEIERFIDKRRKK